MSGFVASKRGGPAVAIMLAAIALGRALATPGVAADVWRAWHAQIVAVTALVAMALPIAAAGFGIAAWRRARADRHG